MEQLKLNLEWLTDDWSPTSVKVFRGKEELTDEGFDNMIARSHGYKDDSDMNHRNYIKDKLCIIKYGNNCNRSKLK
jgi:hypothetical protein